MDNTIASFGVKYLHENTGTPTCNKFVFKPKLFPQISEGVQSIKWDGLKKILKVSICETPKFEVYEWIKFIEEKNIEEQKSPFSNIGSNSVLLSFLDSNDANLANINFQDLSIIEHYCNFQKENNKKPLIQEITLSYKYTEFVLKKVNEESDDLPKVNFNTDEEWRTIKSS